MNARRLYSVASKNLYKVLGLTDKATSPEIKKAYLELAKRFHPDTCKEPGAKDKFLEIQQAYETLSDPEKKGLYDNYGSTSQTSEAGFGASSFHSADIFNTIFSNFSSNRNPFGGFEDVAEVDADVETHVTLSFLEAALGCRKRIRFQRQVSCDACNGSGCDKGHTTTTCTTCKGAGQDTKVRHGFLFSKTCGTCGGTGKLNKHPCSKCKGGRTMAKMEELEISIPAGVTEEYALQFQNKGHSLRQGTGDLIVRFAIGKSANFERKDRDIYSTISIGLTTAVAGGEVTVPTIHGDVVMRVNPGVQPDEMKKLAHKGIQDASRGSGSHYVRLKVEIPRNLSEDQIEQLKSALGQPAQPTQTAQSTQQDLGKSSSSKWFDRIRALFTANK